MPRLRLLVVALALLSAALAVPGSVAAHGPVPHEPPTAATLTLDWRFDPLIVGGLLAAAIGWLLLVRRVAAAHAGHPVPPFRTAAFLAGLAAIAVALLSGIERYDTTLFSVHMVQHLLLMLVAAPLIALSAPITQLLRVASPAWRRRIVGVLHSGPLSALSHPVFAWVTFTLVMWISHFSPLFDAALENPLIHDAEHVAFLAAGLLFWWPVVAADPAPRRLGYPGRALYVLLQMPPSSFLGMLITFASAPLYPHYATLGSPYGIDALADQQTAGGIMWLAGDVVFIVAILIVVAAWMRHEERDTNAAERRADAQRAMIREHADRLARSREEAGTGAAQPAEAASGSGERSSSA
ncbi:MAG TPA: cytochrome c oxidase assembly protein [Candidatus Limnocylindrales bacterium]|nr:cytochrome c oxidase assembly protein [Candidatus Limnocylindrales bacterium]